LRSTLPSSRCFSKSSHVDAGARPAARTIRPAPAGSPRGMGLVTRSDVPMARAARPRAASAMKTPPWSAENTIGSFASSTIEKGPWGGGASSAPDAEANADAEPDGAGAGPCSFFPSHPVSSAAARSGANPR